MSVDQYVVEGWSEHHQTSLHNLLYRIYTTISTPTNLWPSATQPKIITGRNTSISSYFVVVYPIALKFGQSIVDWLICCFKVAPPKECLFKLLAQDLFGCDEGNLSVTLCCLQLYLFLYFQFHYRLIVYLHFILSKIMDG